MGTKNWDGTLASTGTLNAWGKTVDLRGIQIPDEQQRRIHF